MDPLQREEIERTKRMTPEERARALFDVINTGVRLRLAALRARRPHATEEEIQAALREWLADERPDD